MIGAIAILPNPINRTSLFQMDVVRAMADHFRGNASPSPGNSSPGVASETDTEDVHSLISSSLRSTS